MLLLTHDILNYPFYYSLTMEQIYCHESIDTVIKCHPCSFFQAVPDVTSLFSQVEVGDIIKVNGSDFVPADAAILSTRYRSPSCCLITGTPFPRSCSHLRSDGWIHTLNYFFPLFNC